MQIPKDAMLLRIFLGESDRHEHKPLYEAIVLKARETGLAGATVMRGPMGYGHSSHLHTNKILRLSRRPAAGDRDRRQRGQDQRFPAGARRMMGSGLVTLEKVKVLRYGNGDAKA